VDTKAQTVEQSPGAQYTVVPGQAACQISKRIRRIGYDKKYDLGSYRNDPWDHITVNCGVLIEKT
jgi:hypothetical protein